jgi:hypothetical protein
MTYTPRSNTRLRLPVYSFLLLLLFFGQYEFGVAQSYIVKPTQIKERVVEPLNLQTKPIACGKDELRRYLNKLEINANQPYCVLTLRFAVLKSGTLKVLDLLLVDKNKTPMALTAADRKKIVMGINKSCAWQAATMNGKAVNSVIEFTIFLAAEELIEDTDIVEVTPIPHVPKPSSDSTRIFEVVERMPQFVGGQDSLYRYINRHFVKPEEATKNNVTGRVLISFIVNIDGTLRDVKPLLPKDKQLGYGIEEALVELVQNMPPWTPGYQRNKPVITRYTLPVIIK